MPRTRRASRPDVAGKSCHGSTYGPAPLTIRASGTRHPGIAMIVVAIAEPLLSRVLPVPLMAELRQLGPVTVTPSLADSDDIRKLLAKAEILVTGWGSRLVDADVLAMAPRLRAVVHTAGSVRSVVTPEVFAHGVVVSSQTWANALPVAEYTLGMILLFAKDVLRIRDR